MFLNGIQMALRVHSLSTRGTALPPSPKLDTRGPYRPPRPFAFIQVARSRKSGQAWRTKTADRDAAIVAAVQAGESMRQRASDACRFLLSQAGLNCQEGDSWGGVK